MVSDSIDPIDPIPSPYYTARRHLLNYSQADPIFHIKSTLRYYNVMPLKILFIPVSSVKGIGEYMRSLALANALADKIEGIEIRFILSSEVAYAKDCPFPVYKTPTSPTKHNSLVTGYIDEFKPNAVIFDASGRAKQLRHCKDNGIATVFIGQHTKKIYKGLRWQRLRFTDRIWVVQPKFAIEPLSLWAKTKISWLGKHSPVPIGPIFSPPNQERLSALQQQYALEPGKYVIVNAGGGGHHREFEGQRVNTADLFAKAAVLLSKASVQQNKHSTPNLKTVMIYGPNYSGAGLSESDEAIGNGLISIPTLATEDFNSLLSEAHSAILGGGSALLQAISYGLDVVAVAISKDQQERISACVDQGLVSQSPPEPEKMAAAQFTLNKAKKDGESSSVVNGLHAALENLENLLSTTT